MRLVERVYENLSNDKIKIIKKMMIKPILATNAISQPHGKVILKYINNQFIASIFQYNLIINCRFDLSRGTVFYWYKMFFVKDLSQFILYVITSIFSLKMKLVKDTFENLPNNEIKMIEWVKIWWKKSFAHFFFMRSFHVTFENTFMYKYLKAFCTVEWMF